MAKNTLGSYSKVHRMITQQFQELVSRTTDRKLLALWLLELDAHVTDLNLGQVRAVNPGEEEERKLRMPNTTRETKLWIEIVKKRLLHLVRN